MKRDFGKIWRTLCSIILAFTFIAAAAIAEPLAVNTESTAQVSFSEGEKAFVLEAVSPEDTIKGNSMQIDFSGVQPMLYSDTYIHGKSGTITDDRWLKITDTYPLDGWNVTVSMSDFYATDDAGQEPVFSARIRWENIESYRQVGDFDGTIFYLDNDSAFVPAKLNETSNMALISGGPSVKLTYNEENEVLGRGYFLVRFPSMDIFLDTIKPKPEQKIDIETSYTAVITWTGMPTAVN